MIIKHETLFNIDSKGKVRTWAMEVEDNRYRTVSGLQGGKQAVSGWVIAEAKNVGRSNATTGSEQATLETLADYKLKLERKYFRTLEEAQAAGSGMKFFSPMLAKSWKDVEADIPRTPNGSGKIKFPLWAQPKLDGIRGSMSTEDGPLSRGGKLFMTSDHIMKALQSAFDKFTDLRLDGELYNHAFKNDFNQIQSLASQKKPTQKDIDDAASLLEYHVYDTPSHGIGGKFEARNAFLRDEVFPLLPTNCMIKLVPTIKVENMNELNEAYARFLEDGYEGMMVRTDDVYLCGPKRDVRLVKRKEFVDAEFAVSGVEQGLGSWNGCAKKVEFVLPDDVRDDQGNRPKAGCRGTQAFLKEVYDRSQAGDPPKYVTVRFPNYTPGGMPRFGVVTAFYWEERNT